MIRDISSEEQMSEKPSKISDVGGLAKVLAKFSILKIKIGIAFMA